MAGAPAGFSRCWPGVVGTIGGGKTKPTGKIDIAVMQSLIASGRGQPPGRELRSRHRRRVPPCRRVSFDAILKRAKAKYVLGLTATPFRRDGQQPIIFMQCGPIRHTAGEAGPELRTIWRWCRAPSTRESIVLPGSRHPGRVPDNWQGSDAGRTAIAAEIEDAYLTKGRKVLVLTERTEHLDAIQAALAGKVPMPVHTARTNVEEAARCGDHGTRSAGARGAARLARPPASWLARASTIRRSTLWCWRCRSRGKAHCSNTLGVCTANTRPKPTCGSWTSSTRVTPRCCGCGRSVSVGYRAMGYRIKE